MTDTKQGTLAAGMRHLRAEWGRWWRTEDWSDTHIAHHVLNDQFRIWRSVHYRTKSEVRSNIGLLRKQQRQTQTMQMQRMAAMRQMQRSRGGGGRYGGGLGMGMGMGGSSPMIAYKTMQWAELDIKIGQREFEPSGVTPNMLAIGRGQVRARRHRAAAAWLLTAALLWAGIWLLSAAAGLIVTASAALVLLAAAWSAGRNPTKRRPPVPKLLFVPPKPVEGADPEAEPEPFAIREAGRTPRAAREAVRLALAKEKAGVEEVQLPEETSYGWRVPLVLGSGSLADLVRIVPKLTTTLRIGGNRLFVRAADPNDAALVTMHLLTKDPFADPLPYPSRTPSSCSIREAVSLGLSIEGETTPVVLAGQHVLIVAKTGGGKTSMVQALAEYATACHNAAIVDIDVKKRGLKALAPAAVRTARTNADAEQTLDELRVIAESRIAAMPPTQDMWKPTAQHPAVLVFLDEFQALSDRAKMSAVDLLRIGREAMVTLVLSTPDATRDVLGDSIADSFGVRVLLPCRLNDVSIVVGQADAVAQGWLPHLLIPSPDPDDPADAGQFFAVTPKHRTPILRYVSRLTPEEAQRRTTERIAAGLPTLTLPCPEPEAAPAAGQEVPEPVRLLRAAFAAAGDPEELSIGRVGDYLVATDPGTWAKWEDREPRQRTAMIGRALTTSLTRAGVTFTKYRMNEDGSRVTGYRLQDVREFLK